MRKSIRILCLLLCLLLTCSTALAASYTLPEKINRQISSGSGVKGAVTLAVAGGSEWLDLLLPFTGSDLQIRYIVKDNQFQGQLYALDDQDQQRALTQVYGDGEHIYLRSDLLPDTMLSLPAGSGLMDALFGSEDGNPTYYSVVRALLSVPDEKWESDWAPVLEPYEAALEQWLTDFASEPSITQTDNGTSSMTLRYTIPADALKSAMKDLMRQFLQDSALMDLVLPLLSEAQQAAYMNPAISYFYDAVIDALPLQGELTMTRVLSTRGDVLESTLVMPLPDNQNGWSTLTCAMTDRETTLTLTGPEQSVTLITKETAVMSDRTTWDGIFRYLPAEGTPISASFSLIKQFSSYTDEAEGRAHEITNWSLTAKPDLSHLAQNDPARATYAEFEDIVISLSTHFYSREHLNDPTTLEATLSAQLPSLSLDMAMALRTTSPWVLSDLPTTDGELLLELTPERVAELLAGFSRNAALTMTSLTEQTTAEPETETETESSAEPTLVPPAQ
ncbi:MAG: hypothetical protein J1E43_00660 [Christensenellaceae bacterium]|nr:hypothetical protein [Christensenellaceae bacterium]